MTLCWTACRSRRRGTTGPQEYPRGRSSSNGVVIGGGRRGEDECWRPGAADMAPVPQSDRACPVVAIACRGFRAFYVDGKCCAHALCLTAEAIYGSTSSPHLNNTVRLYVCVLSFSLYSYGSTSSRGQLLLLLQ
jgi:hypothetical protein